MQGVQAVLVYAGSAGWVGWWGASVVMGGLMGWWYHGWGANGAMSGLVGVLWVGWWVHSVALSCLSSSPYALLQERWGGGYRDGEEGTEMGRREQRWEGRSRDGRRVQRWGGGYRDGERV